MFFSGFQQFKMHFCIHNLMCKQNYIFYVNFNFNTYCHVNNLYGQVLERKHLNDEDWCCIQRSQSASTKHKLEPFGESSLVLPFALVPSPLLFDVFLDFSSPHFELCIRCIITLSHIHLNKFGKWDVNNEHYCLILVFQDPCKARFFYFNFLSSVSCLVLVWIRMFIPTFVQN